MDNNSGHAKYTNVKQVSAVAAARLERSMGKELQLPSALRLHRDSSNYQSFCFLPGVKPEQLTVMHACIDRVMVVVQYSTK